jgi:hypothetical protein
VTRNPPNRIPGLGFVEEDMQAHHYRAERKRLTGDMLRPSTLVVSFDEDDMLFRSVK